jgi:hypothetical protein
VGTKGVDQLRPLADQEIPCPGQHRRALLLDTLDRYKAHRGRVTASQIAVASAASFFPRFDVGFDIGRRHQPRVVPELLELAGPQVGRFARFHANEARWQPRKELKNLCSTNTLADHHRAIRIDAVNLKHRLQCGLLRRNHAMAPRCRRVGAVHHIIHVDFGLSVQCPVYPR